MSRKYISQRISQNFVYPNNEVAEYDLDIVHDINDYSVSGVVTTFSATTVSSTGITISYNCTWTKNNADPFINGASRLMLFSTHMMAAGQNFYKPFRLVDSVSSATTTLTGSTNSGTFTVLPSQMQLSSFTTGTYYFEVRFIGKRAIYPVCITLPLTIIGPTPTPTPTSTPTPTPTSTVTPTPTPTPTAGSKSLQIYARDIDGTPSTLTLFYSKNGGGNINVPGATATTLPGTCSFIYTITGLTTLDSIVFGTSTACLMNGNGSSSSCPSSSGSATTFTYVIDAPTTQQVALTIDSGTIPSPPITPTPTATPTPTPTSTPVPIPCVCLEIIVTGSTAPEESYAGEIEYNNCSSVLVGEIFTTPGIRYRCVDYTGGVIQVFSSSNVTYSIVAGVSCSSGTCPTGTTITCVCYSYVNTTEGSLTIDYVACDGDQPIIGVPGGSSGTFCARIGQYTGDTGLDITMCSPTIYCQDTETVCESCSGGPTPTPTPTSTPTPTATSTPTPTATSTPTPTPTPTAGSSIEATAGGYMQPCVGGTIDDFMGATVYLSNPVTVDTDFSVTVYYQTIGSSCSYPNITTGASTQSFTITVLAGNTTSTFDACTQGYYFSSGANVCGACVTGSDNIVDTITFINPVGC